MDADVNVTAQRGPQFAPEGDDIVKPLPHRYDVRLIGGPPGYASLGSKGLPELRTAPPQEYGGPGDAWSPEHLLLASVQSCFVFTLRAIARASRIDVVSLDVEAAGTVDRQNGVTRFTEIALRPRLTIPAGTDRERALNLLHKAERACLVSSSLSTPVHVTPDITECEGAPGHDIRVA